MARFNADDYENIRDLTSEIQNNMEDMRRLAASVDNIFESLGTSTSQVGKLQEKIKNDLKESKSSAEGFEKIQNSIEDILTNHKNLGNEIKSSLFEQLDAAKQHFDEIQKIEKAEEKRVKIQDSLQKKADGIFDGIESQVRKIPLVGDLLADTLDFGGMKKEFGGILKGVTQNFMSLKAGGMSTGAAISESFGAALPLLKQFGKMLLASLGPIMLVVGALYLIKKAFDFNKETTQLAKDLGISVDEARDMEESFNEISGSSKNLSTTTKKLIEAQKQLSSATGMTSQFSTQMLEDQIKLTKYMGLSGDEAANFQKIAMSNGQTARELQGEIAGSVEQFNNATGASVSLKDVVQDIAKLPADIRVGFKGTTAELAQTVALARTMGTTLEESVEAAQKTLDIESSLKAEAKARVLTGVNINNNAIRAAQIAGDYDKVLSLQREQLAEIDNFNEMAPVQQKAIADAMGMTVDQVVKQKEQMELAKKAGIDLESATLEQLKNAQGLTDEERDKLIKQHEQMSAQEKLSAMQEKLGDLINSIVAGPLGEFVGVLVDSLLPAFEAVQTVLSPIFKILGYILKAVFAIINPIIKLGAFIVDLLFTPFESIFGIIDGVVMLFEDFDKGLAMIGNSLIDYLLYPLEVVAKLADGIVSVFTLGFADLGAEAAVKGMADSMKTEVPQNAVTADGEKIDDGIVKPDGTVVKTNPADFIMAMKNPMDLFSGIGNMFGGGESVSIDYDKLAEAISKQPILLTIDGKAVQKITRVQSRQSVTTRGFN